MIKWAREDAGLSIQELPKNLQKSALWETGEQQPTWSDLRELAKKYKRPTVFYLMSQAPEDENNKLIEFRPPEKIKTYSYELRLELRKAKYRRNAYLNINFEMNNTIPDFSKYHSSEKNYKKLANHILNILNTPIKTRETWKYNSRKNRNMITPYFYWNGKKSLQN